TVTGEVPRDRTLVIYEPVHVLVPENELFPVKALATPSMAMVSVAAGTVMVKLDAEEAAAKVSTPPPDEVSLRPLAAKVCAAVQLCARFNSATIPVLDGNVAVVEAAAEVGASVNVLVVEPLNRVMFPATL